MSDCKAPPGRAASAPRKAERNESIIDKHVAVGAFVFDFFGPPERSERGENCGITARSYRFSRRLFGPLCRNSAILFLRNGRLVEKELLWTPYYKTLFSCKRESNPRNFRAGPGRSSVELSQFFLCWQRLCSKHGLSQFLSNGTDCCSCFLAIWRSPGGEGHNAQEPVARPGRDRDSISRTPGTLLRFPPRKHKIPWLRLKIVVKKLRTTKIGTF